MTTIAIIEENRITRAGIEQIVACKPDLTVVASVPSVDDLAALGAAPDVVVVSLAACDLADPYGEVKALAGRSAVVVICGKAGRRIMLSALLAGASGLVTLDTDPHEFLAAVEACARGGLYLDGNAASCLGADLWQHRRTDDQQGLAPREIATLRLLSQGYTHGQIARRLGLTEATVNTYVKRIRVKLNAGNKAELTRIAIDLGYADAGRSGAPLRSVSSGMVMPA